MSVILTPVWLCPQYSGLRLHHRLRDAAETQPDARGQSPPPVFVFKLRQLRRLSEDEGVQQICCTLWHHQLTFTAKFIFRTDFCFELIVMYRRAEGEERFIRERLNEIQRQTFTQTFRKCFFVHVESFSSSLEARTEEVAHCADHWDDVMWWIKWIWLIWNKQKVNGLIRFRLKTKLCALLHSECLFLQKLQFTASHVIYLMFVLNLLWKSGSKSQERVGE